MDLAIARITGTNQPLSCRKDLSISGKIGQILYGIQEQMSRRKSFSER